MVAELPGNLGLLAVEKRPSRILDVPSGLPVVVKDSLPTDVQNIATFKTGYAVPPERTTAHFSAIASKACRTPAGLDGPAGPASGTTWKLKGTVAFKRPEP